MIRELRLLVVNCRYQAISLKTPVGGILSDKAMLRQLIEAS